MGNYIVYHLHSDYSSCVTNIDSVTKVSMYVDRAKELGMSAMAFSEHGSVLNWYEKKTKIEAAGMKYIHAAEVYLTETLDEKVRDNYHCVLIARNHEGFKELNVLTSNAFRRDTNNFYYNPRILLSDLMSTSNNIIITTACLGGLLNKASEETKGLFIQWMVENKDRCFLEIQHHNVAEQKEYNQYLYNLHKKTGLKLIAGTDTHSLNEELAEARLILQEGKKTRFKNEEKLDLVFKSYDELIDSYRKQNSIPIESAIEAIDNTNVLYDMVESFEVDTSAKYPKLYENPEEEFSKSIQEAIDRHPYVKQRHSKDIIDARVAEEIEVFKETNMIDFMLFQKYVRDYEKSDGIHVGPGRGSITGSFVAYLLGITEMDSIKFDLNFFRFAHKYRVSLADVDSDYYSTERDRVRNFLLTSDRIKSSEICTFNTIKLKGAIRDVGRALDIPLPEISNICDRILVNDSKEDYAPDDLRDQYKDLFKYVDLLNGVIVSIGTHPAGVVCATDDIQSGVGTIHLSTTNHPVSAIDKYALDDLWWTKLDCLGLDNVGIINECCKLAGIDKISPDNIDLQDWNVWRSIRDDTAGIFQFESPSATHAISKLFRDEIISNIRKEIPDIQYLKLMSFANALIRPCGTSVINDVINGLIKKTGIREIDDLLRNELGQCLIQEDIMLFLMKFCGYSLFEADMARKVIAKKKGTAELLPKVKDGFIKNSKEKYSLSDSKVEEIIEPILRCILDASRYAFSQNHSDAYSFIGYACGYLRYYYPLEFITTCLNIWDDDEEKTASIIQYATKNRIIIKEPKFRYSKSEYFFDNDTKIIYKGIKSIKFMNSKCAEDLYSLRNEVFESFTDLLLSISKMDVNSRQLTILINLGFFSEFGNSKELLLIYENFDLFKSGEAKSFKIEKFSNNPTLASIVERYSKKSDKQYSKLETPLILREYEEYLKCQGIQDFTIREKISYQNEILGYIGINTGKEEDRRKLIVLSKKILISKTGKNIGKPWCVVVKTQSIGSGIRGEFSIKYGVFLRCQFVENDLIYCDAWERSRGYNYITKYHKI